MHIELSRIKNHLNIDSGFTQDDEYITYLETVAEQIVEKHIDNTLENIIAEEGAVPAPLLQAMLLIIGNLYDNRESVSYTNAVEVPNTLSYILSMYRDYNNSNI
jgi:uncharacterized phage protein (predicted DNA packaging)